MLTRANIQDIYELSPVQEGLLYQVISNESQFAYFEQYSYLIPNSLDVNRVRHSFNWLVERHDVLRTVFNLKKAGKPLQVVLKECDSTFRFEDISSLSGQEQESFLESFKEKDKQRSFSIEKENLTRLTLFKLASDRFSIIWSFHHLVVDGQSISILENEFWDCYLSKTRGIELNLSSPFSYRTYIEVIKGLKLEEGKSFFDEALSGVELEGASSSYDVEHQNKTEVVHLEINESLTSKIKALTARYGCTVNVFFQTIWGLIQSRTRDSDNHVFGTVVNGRFHQLRGIDTGVGLFVNTIPVVFKSANEGTFKDRLLAHHEWFLKSLNHHHIPLFEIGRSTEPLFDNVLIFQNFQQGSITIDADENEQEIDRTVFGVTHYPLSFVVSEMPSTISLKFIFYTIRHKPERIRQMVRELEYLIDQVTSNPESSLERLSIVPEHVQERMAEFNQTEVPFPDKKSLIEILDQSYVDFADRVAIVDQDRSLTFKALFDRAHQLALSLNQKNAIPTNRLVGVMMDRSADLMITLLAVLKAGAAYVPIDPDSPQNRIQELLDSGGIHVLIHNESADKLSALTCELFSFGDLMRTIHGNPPSDADLPYPSDKDLIYAIFTSGSTGKPKGVLLENRGVVNKLHWTAKRYGFSKDDILLQQTPFMFDVSVRELFMPLWHGGKMVIGRKEHVGEVQSVMPLISKYCITITDMRPSMVNAVGAFCKRNPDEKVQLKSLRHLLTGGESVLPETVKQHYELFTFPLHNNYGPTEASIYVTSHETNPKEEEVSIGGPIDNVSMYVLDRHMRLLPIGVEGDLYIGGLSVARGYLNRVELTHERFVHYQDDRTGEVDRLYATGDRALWTDQGTLLFRGRIDFQVKFRGQRIELEEIENKTMSHPGVVDCVVRMWNDEFESQFLVAYIAGAVSEGEIRAYLMDLLPINLVPSYFIFLDKLPKTPTGKVDRRALPDPEHTASKVDIGFVDSGIQERVLEVWKSVFSDREVGLQDNFFAIGGHSIKSLRLISMIEKEFSIRLKPQDIYMNPTVPEIAALLKPLTASDTDTLKQLEEQDYYPVSHAQKRLWILDQEDGLRGAYIIYDSWFIEGSFAEDLFVAAVKILIEKHAIYRTRFVEQFGEIHQQVISPETYQLPLKVRHFETADQYPIREIKEATVDTVNLERGAAWSISVNKLEENKYCISQAFHHIITDASSIGLFLNELLSIYTSLLSEKPVDPKQPALQYVDCAVYQNDHLNEIRPKASEFWKKVFSKGIPKINWPFKPRPTIRTYEGLNATYFLELEELEKVSAFAVRQEVTLFTTLLSTLYIVLSKLTQDEDIVFGIPVRGRTVAAFEEQHGVFINTLPVRLDESKASDFINLSQAIQEKVNEVLTYEGYPFDLIVEDIDPVTDPGRSPFFDVLVNYVASDPDAERQLGLPEAVISRDKSHSGASAFDMSIDFFPYETELQISIDYSTELFAPEHIDWLINTFKQVLLALTGQPGQLVNDVQVNLSEIGIQPIEYSTNNNKLVSDAQRNQLLNEFNDTDIVFSGPQTIMGCFEHQLTTHGSKVALLHNDQALTYQNLNVRAGQIAQLILEKGARRNDIVAVSCNRSFELITGILGVLKAGCTYLPIDPRLPDERIFLLMRDCNTRVLVTNETTTIAEDIELVDLNGITLGNAEFVSIEIEPDDPAYVIFTSGSTGIPKGVVISHQSVINLVRSQQATFTITDRDRILLFSSISFDQTVEQMWLALLNRASLVITDEDTILDEHKFNRYFADKAITHAEVTPSYLESIDFIPKKGLRNLIVGGESCSSSLVRTYVEQYNFYNSYGPTEVTVTSVMNKLSVKDEYSPAIGRPLANTYCYVLDDALNLTPIGATGELYIGGAGLALGYLNNPELTAARFMPNPFREGEKMYKTGDLVKWTTAGKLEYLGRNDQQVKIRGYRIELAEIEHVIDLHQAISQSVVLLKGTKQHPYLVAYCICSSLLESEELKTYIAKKLPEYMIPAHFIFLDKFPLTTSGKMDVAALPEPQFNEVVKGRLPGNEQEKALASAWSKVTRMDVAHITLESNFFELGGNSLQALKLCGEFYRSFGAKMSFRDIMKFQTLEEQVSLLVGAPDDSYVPVAAAEEQVHYPVSNAQFRIWLLTNEVEEAYAYNSVDGFFIRGTLDLDRFRKAVLALVARHETLRANFRIINEQVRSVFREAYDPLSVEDQRGRSFDPLNCLENEMKRQVDLANDPLLHMRLLHIGDQEYFLTINLHHILSDPRSLFIIVEEIAAYYQKGAYPQPAIQFKDYLAWWQGQYTSDRLSAMKSYWMETLGTVEPHQLLTDFDRHTEKTLKGAAQQIMISAKKMPDIDRFRQSRDGITPFIFYLSVLKLLIYKYTGQKQITIGSPVSLRNNPEVDQLIGYFMNSLAFTSEADGDATFEKYLAEVATQVTNGFDHFEYPFDLIVQDLDVKTELGRSPLYDIVMIYNDVETIHGNKEVTRVNELSIENFESPGLVSKFDLTFVLSRQEGGELMFNLIYNSSLFKPETITNMQNDYMDLLNQVIAQPTWPLRSFEVVGRGSVNLSLIESDTLEGF